MKVLICSAGYNSPTKNTVGIFQLDQAKALKEYGHDVRIATLDLRSLRRWRSFSSYSFIQDGIPVFTVNRPCGRVPAFIINSVGKRAARKAFAMACGDGWRPDIIHAHFTNMAYCFADIASESEIPFVVTEHNSAMNNAHTSPSTLQMARYAYPRADALLAVSGLLADSIMKKTGKKAAVVSNITDTSVFKCDSSRGTASDSFCFVSAGTLIKRKGMDILLDAFSAIDMKNSTLVIMGDGEERAALEKQATALGLADRVVFFGKYERTQFRDILQSADCFVLASRLETFGVVYIEAMAAGVPVIATRCGGPEDFVTEDAGLLVPVDDTAALTKAMNDMITSAEHYDKDRISAYANAHFSPESISEKLTGVYNTVLDKRQ